MFAPLPLVILGPMIAVFTADYYMVRRRKVKLSDLYHHSPKGIYWFTYGINFRSYISWFLGFAPSLGGMASVDPVNDIPIGLTKVFYTGFITGYAISFGVHCALNALFPPAGLAEVDSYDSVCANLKHFLIIHLLIIRSSGHSPRKKPLGCISSPMWAKGGIPGMVNPTTRSLLRRMLLPFGRRQFDHLRTV